MIQLSDRFAWGSQTYIVGILNLTTDSFSGDGLLQQPNWQTATLQQAHAMLSAGAHILDIGASSSRPGAPPLPATVELERLLPIVQLLAAETDAILSIDTCYAAVADATLAVGAHLINDVSCLQTDPDLAAVVAKWQAGLIILHNRTQTNPVTSTPGLGSHYGASHYTDLIADVLSELQHAIQIARTAGVAQHQIIIDPGIGFAKTIAQNLALSNQLDRLLVLGYPILYGPSRKSFIGYTLNQPPTERVWGTAAAVAVGIARGADLIRVHDVAAMAQVARLADAITRPSNKPERTG